MMGKVLPCWSAAGRPLMATLVALPAAPSCGLDRTRESEGEGACLSVYVVSVYVCVWVTVNVSECVWVTVNVCECVYVCVRLCTYVCMCGIIGKASLLGLYQLLILGYPFSDFNWSNWFVFKCTSYQSLAQINRGVHHPNSLINSH